MRYMMILLFPNLCAEEEIQRMLRPILEKELPSLWGNPSIFNAKDSFLLYFDC